MSNDDSLAESDSRGDGWNRIYCDTLSRCNHIVAVIDDKVVRVFDIAPLELARMFKAGQVRKFCPECGERLVKE